MKESSVPAGVSAEDWAATPLAVRVLVAALQEQVVGLTEQVQTLTARVAALEEQVRQSSRNSSKPPERVTEVVDVRPRPAGAAACRWWGTTPSRGAIRCARCHGCGRW